MQEELKNTTNNTKDKKTIIGVFIVIGITIITLILLKIFQLKGFPKEFVAPDYNHFFPILIVWLIAFIGIGFICLICFKKDFRGWLFSFFAIFFSAIIVLSVYGIMSKKEYYYFDKEYHWCKRNYFHMTTTYPVGYYLDGEFIFGNTLLLQLDTTQTCFGKDSAVFFQNPTIYFKDGSKTTIPYVSKFLGELPRTSAVFCEEINKGLGVMDGDGNVIVKPGQYEDVSMYKYRRHINVKNDGKWGLINMKGDIVIPCEYDTMKCVDISDYLFFDGGFLMTFTSRNEFVMTDTLGRSISYEEYHSKYPNVTIDKRGDKYIVNMKLDGIYIENYVL